MSNLDIQWHDKNKKWKKTLGAWITENGNRVPREFYFHFPNTPEGKRQAQNELIPLLAQWAEIKSKSKGKPVWHRDIKVKEFDIFTMSEKEMLNYVAPVSAMEWSIQETVDKYLEHWGKTAKAYSVRGVKYHFSAIFKSFDQSQNIRLINVSEIIDGYIDRIAKGTIKARSAYNYAQALKSLFEWYRKQTGGKYQLGDEWAEMFLKKRFKNPQNPKEILSEDGEKDFQPFSISELKSILAFCNTDRQKLYVLLALNAGMYFVDITAMKKQDIYLNDEKPYLLYKREKESHHDNPIICKCWLWADTVKLLKSEMNKSDTPNALNDEMNKPLSRTAIAMVWKRLKKLIDKRIGRSCRFMDLRKSGATHLANISSIELADLYLGHKVQGMAGKYIKIAKDRLYDPMMALEQQIFTKPQNPL